MAFEQTKRSNPSQTHTPKATLILFRDLWPHSYARAFLSTEPLVYRILVFLQNLDQGMWLSLRVFTKMSLRSQRDGSSTQSTSTAFLTGVGILGAGVVRISCQCLNWVLCRA